MKLNLSESDPGFELIMEVPEGTEAAADYGYVELVAGDGFKLEVRKGEIDMEERKAAIEGNSMNELQSFHVDDSTAILYETALFGQSEFHLLVTMTVGGVAYYFEDTKGPSYTREQADEMLAACRSAQAAGS